MLREQSAGLLHALPRTHQWQRARRRAEVFAQVVEPRRRVEAEIRIGAPVRPSRLVLSIGGRESGRAEIVQQLIAE
jgi:hypothetical protein